MPPSTIRAGAGACTGGALARAAAITRAAGNKDAERGGHDIKTFGDILADMVKRTAAARTCLIGDIDDLLDPFKMGWQRTAVGLAGTLTFGLLCFSFTRCTGGAQCCLDLFEAKLELVGIELLGLGAETVTHEGIDDRLQPLDLYVSLALRGRQIGFGSPLGGKHAGLHQSQRAERFDVAGQVRFDVHERIESANESPVNRQFAVLSGGVRHAPGASPNPQAKRQVGLL
jgi:hypothetical protein